MITFYYVVTFLTSTLKAVWFQMKRLSQNAPESYYCNGKESFNFQALFRAKSSNSSSFSPRIRSLLSTQLSAPAVVSSDFLSFNLLAAFPLT